MAETDTFLEKMTPQAREGLSHAAEETVHQPLDADMLKTFAEELTEESPVKAATSEEPLALITDLSRATLSQLKTTEVTSEQLGQAGPYKLFRLIDDGDLRADQIIELPSQPNDDMFIRAIPYVSQPSEGIPLPTRSFPRIAIAGYKEVYKKAKQIDPLYFAKRTLNHQQLKDLLEQAQRDADSQSESAYQIEGARALLRGVERVMDQYNQRLLPDVLADREEEVLRGKELAPGAIEEISKRISLDPNSFLLLSDYLKQKGTPLVKTFTAPKLHKTEAGDMVDAGVAEVRVDLPKE